MADRFIEKLQEKGILPTHRVALGEAGFRALVRGEIVRLQAADDHYVELILSDIGFGRMVDAVNEAIIEAPVAKRWRDDP